MENKEEKGLKKYTSERGFEYIQTDSGLKIRNSFRADRITEDEETYEEYRIRRRLAQNAEKKNREAILFWDSSRVGTYTPERAERLKEFLENQKEEENA